MSEDEKLKSKLEKLHVRLIDAVNGYDEGVSKTDSPSVKTAFQSLREMHHRHAREIDRFRHDLGDTADASGSWMTPVNEAMMDVRSWFGALDPGVLDTVASAEERIADLTAEAAACAAPNETIRIALVRQHAEIASQIKMLKETA